MYINRETIELNYAYILLYNVIFDYNLERVPILILPEKS